MPSDQQQPWKEWYTAQKPTEVQKDYVVEALPNGNTQGTMLPEQGAIQIDLTKPKGGMALEKEEK